MQRLGIVRSRIEPGQRPEEEVSMRAKGFHASIFRPSVTIFPLLGRDGFRQATGVQLSR